MWCCLERTVLARWAAKRLSGYPRLLVVLYAWRGGVWARETARQRSARRRWHLQAKFLRENLLPGAWQGCSPICIPNHYPMWLPCYGRDAATGLD
jgi:hypothetical protein